jgi:hypothetical protein
MCLLLLTCATLSVLRAECSANQCYSVQITQLWSDAGTSANGDVWFQTTGTESNLNCTASGGIWLRLPSTATAKKDVYALLMMAFALERPLVIGLIAGSADCIVAWAYLYQ